MSVIRLLIVTLFAGASIGCEVSRDNDGQIVEEARMDIFQLRVGDCTNDPQGMTDEEFNSTDFETVQVVPCGDPHDNEFYVRFDLNHQSFPGDEVIDEEAWEFCMANFEGFVGIPYEDSVLDITYFYPTVESWNKQNDREVICGVYHMDLEKLTGTARDTQI